MLIYLLVSQTEVTLSWSYGETPNRVLSTGSLAYKNLKACSKDRRAHLGLSVYCFCFVLNAIAMS
jgi:hypothetical protein